MPALVAAFGQVILWALGNLVGRVMLGLGLGVVAYKGVDLLINQVEAKVSGLLGGIDAMFLPAIHALGLIQGIQIILAAYAARFATQTAYRLSMARAEATP